MSKRFHVKILLELHAITCPGVWLCSSGFLEATIKTLGYFFKTGTMEPRFPALCHDQFVMEGYFKSVQCMTELEQALGAENIEITLWQNGKRLAFYVGKLADVMNPPVPKLTCFHNVNVQILMNPSQAFPGIIAPKLEISARAVVQDKKCSGETCSMATSSNHSLLVPNLQNGCSVSTSHSHDENHRNFEHRRQRPVCHSKVFGSQHVKPPSGNSVSTFHNQSQCLSSKDSILSLSESRLPSRRMSSFSISTTSNACSLISDSNLSKCSHVFSNPSDTEDHQRHCDICQSYSKAFNPAINF